MGSGRLGDCGEERISPMIGIAWDCDCMGAAGVGCRACRGRACRGRACGGRGCGGRSCGERACTADRAGRGYNPGRASDMTRIREQCARYSLVIIVVKLIVEIRRAYSEEHRGGE
jgi:hypothetical protein